SDVCSSDLDKIFFSYKPCAIFNTSEGLYFHFLFAVLCNDDNECNFGDFSFFNSFVNAWTSPSFTPATIPFSCNIFWASSFVLKRCLCFTSKDSLLMVASP